MTTARIATAGDSPHATPLRDETRYESTTPATTPIRVPKRRLRTKSKAGPESVTSPEATDPATGRGTPKTGATVTATIAAVRKRPGRTRRLKPTAVRESTRNEIPVPP